LKTIRSLGKATTKPKTEFAKAVAKALTRAAKRARTVARQYGTSIHVQSNGAVVALKP
jgi:ribosomal protein S5